MRVLVRFDLPYLSWRASPPAFAPLLGSLTFQLSHSAGDPSGGREVSLHPRAGHVTVVPIARAD